MLYPNINLLQYYSEELAIIVACLLFGFIIAICWHSTALNPLNYNLWLVQIQSTPRHRILRIVSMTDQVHDPDHSSPSLSPEENMEGDITNLLVIQTPNSIEQNIPVQISDQTIENSIPVENGFATSSGLTGQDLHSPASGTILNQENSEMADSSQILTIRLKFLDDSQKLVQSNKNTSIGTFKRQHFSEYLAAGKVIRLIFQGRLLRDDRSTLDSYGLQDQCVVHCHIGNRPYTSSTQNDGNQQQMENANGNNSNMPIGARLTTGTWMDLLLLNAWNIILLGWEWANTTQQIATQNQSFLSRSTEYLRSALRIFLDMLFGSFIRRDGQRRDGDNENENIHRFNVGQLLALLIFVKFMLLWTFVLLYPQFTDRRSLFLLMMLTGTTGLYFYFNRTNSPISNRRRAE